MDTNARAAIITHTVRDYGVWRAGFDAHAAARTHAGIVGHHINRAADDPNTLTIYLAARSDDALRTFVASSALREAMKSAGAVSDPVVVTLSPQDDRAVKKPSAAAIVVHEVADYAIWKHAFDRHDTARKQAGIIGYAVNRRTDSPNTIVVYLQADSIDRLERFMSSPDLAAAMQGAGVIGTPQVTFVQGEDWVSYE